MKERHDVKEREFVFYLFLITVAILLLPPALRFFSNNAVIAGGEAYFHIGAAEDILKGDFTDALNEERLSLNPYHYLLAAVGHFLGVKMASLLVPITLGILSSMVFFLILKKLQFSLMSNFIICLLFILSPLFIFSFTISTFLPLSLFLILCGFYMFMSHTNPKSVKFCASVLCFVAASLISLFNILFISSLVLGYSYIKKKVQRDTLYVLLAMIIAYLIYPTGIFYQLEAIPSGLPEFVTDLGGILGFGIFNIILAVIGIFSSWKLKKKYYAIYILAFALLVFSYFISYYINAYANFLFAVFAGIGFIYVRNIKWRLPVLRSLTMLIIICGLLFSTISFMNRISAFEPSNGQIESLRWISTRVEGNVLSHQKYGFLIENIAGKKPMLNGMEENAEAANDAENIFQGYDLEKTLGLIKKHDIRYIWVTKEMKEGLVWKKEKQGLLFLFRNTETFKKIYSSQDAEIWRVIR